MSVSRSTWTRQMCSELIDLYDKQTVLWKEDLCSPPHLKNNAWMKIKYGLSFEKSVTEIQNKINQLRREIITEDSSGKNHASNEVTVKMNCNGDNIMKESSITNNVPQLINLNDETDDSVLYARIFCKKLMKLDESMREMAMLDIDKIFVQYSQNRKKK